MILRNKTTVLAFLTMCGAFTGIAASASRCEDKQPTPVDPAILKNFAQENNQFGMDLFQQLRQKPGNLFISPYSISSALSMTATGARGNTAQQMTKVLHVPEDIIRLAGLNQGLMSSLLAQPKGYDIRIANALWCQDKYPFKQDFTGLVQRSFRAEARSLDFVSDTENSRTTINQWVETQTNNRIKDLLPQGTITPMTRLVLTNAIYFKGTWSTPFNKSLTKPVDFNLSSNDKIKSDMMYRSANMKYSVSDQLQLVELPYQGDRLTMVVLLPRKLDGLEEVETSLSLSSLNAMLAAHKSVKVNLTLPKIKTTCSANLNKTLSSMGMTDAFESGKADFSGMDGTRELFISDVIHKAFCEINEEGTEAAAATGVVMKPMSAVPVRETPIEFKADHPYLYLIRDTQTGAILFLGRVADPRS